MPQLLTGDTIDLEGNELRVIRIGQADTAHSTLLHIPSLAAVVTGDLAYNEVHMMTGEAGQAELAQWIANLNEVAELNPAIVVAGHKKVDNGDDPKIIEESQQYLPGLLPHHGRGEHRSRDRRPHDRDLPRLGQPPHHLVLRESSHRAQAR